MFRERMIVDDSLVVDDGGYSMRVRIPWYRALPLSCILELSVAVDDHVAPPEAITIEVDGVARSLGDATRVWDQSWYVLDDLVVHVADVRLEDQVEHEVSLTLGLRIPYLPMHGKPVTITERYTKTMPAKEHAA